MAFEKARDYDMVSFATRKPSEEFSGECQASPSLFCYAGGCLVMALETPFQDKLSLASMDDIPRGKVG